jgi:cobalt transporter subunit CbtB
MHKIANPVSRRAEANDIAAMSMSKLAAIASAGLLGLFIVLALGMAPLAAVHNATHDVRHVAGFPCH